MSEKPTDGWGVPVSDVQFLLSCLDYIIEATGESLDEEDMAIVARIRAETT